MLAIAAVPDTSDGPKFMPKMDTLEFADAAEFSAEKNDTTGASKVNTFSTVPTRAPTVAIRRKDAPVPASELHESVVADDHMVVVHDEASPTTSVGL